MTFYRTRQDNYTHNMLSFFISKLYVNVTILSYHSLAATYTFDNGQDKHGILLWHGLSWMVVNGKVGQIGIADRPKYPRIYLLCCFQYVTVLTMRIMRLVLGSKRILLYKWEFYWTTLTRKTENYWWRITYFWHSSDIFVIVLWL